MLVILAFAFTTVVFFTQWWSEGRGITSELFVWLPALVVVIGLLIRGKREKKQPEGTSNPYGRFRASARPFVNHPPEQLRVLLISQQLTD